MEKEHSDHVPESTSVRNRHLAIIREYDRLCREEEQKDPRRAKYITKGYYIKQISEHPLLGMSENYILKIINSRHTYERHGIVPDAETE